jgi:hypothetical protein
MKNTWMKTLTGVSAIGLLMTANLQAQEEGVLVKPDKNDVTSLKVTGRVQFQAAYVDQSNDVNSGDWSTLEVRRARIGASGKFAHDISAKVEANVKPGETNVSSAYLSWASSDAFNLTVGFDKPMTSLEENTSSASIITVERSNVNNIIAAPGETTGVWISGEKGAFFYHVGLYNGEDVEESRNTSNEEAEYLFNIHGGVNMELSESTSVKAQISYAQTDDPNAGLGFEDTTVASLHLDSGAFELRTEYFMATDGDDDTTGFYIMPSMMVTDSLEAVLRYEYVESDSSSGVRASSRYGRRTDVVEIPATEVDEETGEVTATTATADKGDEYSAIYLGVNYYLQKYSKVMLGVEFSELENTGAGTLETTTVFSAWRVRF